MRIAFVIQDLFGRGAEYATALLVRGFVAKGYDVDLLVSKVHDDKLAEGQVPFEIPATTHVIHLRDRKARNNIGELRQYLKTTDASAVVVMGGGSELAVPLASLGLFHCPRLYLVRHTIDFALNKHLKYKDPPSAFRHFLKAKLRYGRYAGVLCVAERVRQEMIRFGRLNPKRVHTVYNPVIDESFFTKRNQPPTHPWLVKRDLPTFVAAGAFEVEKDHLTILKALKVVNETRPARVIIFGRGSHRPKYEQFIRENGLEDRVSLPGYSNALPAEIAASSGYVSSSVLESFGIAIVEALACGVPVIATDAPCGPREVLDDGKYGAVVPPGDVDALAQAMLEVVGRGRSSAEDESWRRFEISRIVERYERALGL